MPYNPDSEDALELAEVSRSRAALSLARANQELSRLLREGVKVPYRDEKGRPLLVA